MTLPAEGTPAARAVLQKRYAAIELAYSEQNWSQAESLSAELLAELPDVAGDPLRQRLLLLLGHTRLYGMADTTAARGYYGAVLEQSEEPTLREIAEQGLAQCLELEQPATGEPQATGNAATPWLQPQADGSTDGSRHDPPPAVTGGAAAPWLHKGGGGTAATPTEGDGAAVEPAAAEEASGDDTARIEPASGPAVLAATAPGEPEQTASAEALAVEIVEEPEQIAVAQADPQRREELELEEQLVLGNAELKRAEPELDLGLGRDRNQDQDLQELVAVAASREEAEIPAATEPAPLSEALIAEFSRNLLRLRLN